MAEDEERAIASIVERLRAAFDDLPETAVIEAVAEARAKHRDSNVRDFVPLLVERAAREHLERSRSRRG